jgi:hypothetical protein
MVLNEVKKSNLLFFHSNISQRTKTNLEIGDEKRKQTDNHYIIWLIYVSN